MRKHLSHVILAALLVLITFGWAAKTNVVHAQNADIAVLLPDSQSSDRWENEDRVFLQQAFDAAGVTYNITNAQNDAAQQATQADAALTNGAKVILLVNLDSASAAGIIAKGHAAGAKMIDYDRLTLQGGADAYVSFDNVSVGRLQGLGLALAIAAAGIQNPRIAFLDGSPDDNNATLFAQGAHSILDLKLGDATSGWTKVDEQAVPKWDNTQAQTIFEQMLTASGGKIDAALAANDGLGIAVATALKNQGLPYIPTTGQDATVGGVQHVLEGSLSMTVYKAIKAQANAAAALAVAMLKGDDTSGMTSGTVNDGNQDIPSVLLVPVGVTKDNVKATVIADGFRTWDEICVGDYEQFCPPADQR
jgi:D-xylose transport system substrate-binding protein